MKNAKQWLSVILSIVVVFTMALTPAMAAGTDNGSAATITVETVQKEVKAGDEVTLNVSIADNPGFAAFDFTVKYDRDKLELTKAEKGNIEGNFTGNKDTGKVNLYVDANAGEHTDDGVLFTLTFNVKADCADGAQVTLETTTFKNAQNVKLNPTIVAGGINVTTGGGTTGGGTTGGGTTGGGTTGGGTTGGSTTGGSTTGGSTTGGSTTGGSTTGGSTTGGGTTGGSTTGGSTTGGSTTGGSTTGGSTTGGGTTGGGTTGGGTTGGGTTGGGSTGGGSTGGGSSSGSGSSYTSGMSFTTDLPADSITRVTVNGKKLDSKYYTVSSNGSGSIVTLTDAYLATLKAGTYTIKIESATHVSTGTFTIKADGTPKTADAGIALYAVMAVSSLMGTAVVSKKCRKA